ncbi:MAG: hypothetical protein EOP35_04505 [Rubrivivax sp.]|nr:MAG: hypothetical protein EOP35_04505 [Rubrivivax sp.]
MRSSNGASNPSPRRARQRSNSPSATATNSAATREDSRVDAHIVDTDAHRSCIGVAMPFSPGVPMSIRLLARAFASLTFIAASLTASAASYSGLVVFGDSLSDGGNIAGLYGTSAAPIITSNADYRQIPSTFGTYSNGKVWTQYLAQSLALPLSPSIAGGNNYAFGGAQTATDGPGLSPSLSAQLNGFYLASGAIVDPNALYVLAGGSNDVRVAMESALAGGTVPADMVTQYGADMRTMVDTLTGLGAKHVLVLNLPDFGLTPMATTLGAATGVDTVSLARGLSMQMNASLAGYLDNSGARIFDTFGFMTSAVQTGTSFSNVTDACLLATSCDGYLFWDGIHPTTQAHQLLASAVLSTVTAVPEPDVTAMLALGLVVLAVSGARRRARQQPR